MEQCKVGKSRRGTSVYLSYHLPLIASIEMCAVTSNDELINNSEKEYERIAWMKCTSQQVSEYQRRLYESIIGIDDNTLYSPDDVENYYRFICRSVKFSDECLPRKTLLE